MASSRCGVEAQDFPEHRRRKYTQKVNRKMYRAGVAAINSRSWSARTAGGVDSLTAKHPRPVAGAKDQGRGWMPAVDITDSGMRICIVFT